MKELNELVELAKKATPGQWFQSPYDTGARFCAQVWDSNGQALLLHDGKGDVASNDVAFIAAANPETILAIAEAFQALEKERDTLQAQLAELERQEPVGFYRQGKDKGFYLSTINTPRPGCVPLFRRPAPAINLAELVPDEVTASDAECSLSASEADSWAAGVNWVISKILRNIEEKT